MVGKGNPAGAAKLTVFKRVKTDKDRVTPWFNPWHLTPPKNTHIHTHTYTPRPVSQPHPQTIKAVFSQETMATGVQIQVQNKLPSFLRLSHFNSADLLYCAFWRGNHMYVVSSAYPACDPASLSHYTLFITSPLQAPLVLQFLGTSFCSFSLELQSPHSSWHLRS